MNISLCARRSGTLAATCLVIGASLVAQQPPPAPPAANAVRPAPLRSPDIHPDRTVTFRLLAPKATEVTLNGSWDSGTNLKMTKDEAGVWSTTIGPLAPQLWGYWFMVDGVKALDPNNAETQRDGARYDNLLMISGAESEWWDFKDVPHGTVQAVWYPSPTLKLASRRMMVYTPPGYEAGKPEVSRLVPAAWRRRRRRCVADDGSRQHHLRQPHRRGQGEADDRRDAERQRHADGVAGLRLRPHAGAAVGPGAGAAAASGGTGGWRTGGAPGGRGGAPQPYAGSYPESLVKDVIPFVEKRFRVLAAKDDRAIAGLSMGGGHTLAATNNNPGTFDYIGVFSSGPQAVDETFQKQLEAVKAGGVKFYWLGAGSTDMARERTVTLSQLVKKDGFNTTYREIPGRHYWFLWRDFLVHYAQIAFVPAAKSAPTAR